MLAGPALAQGIALFGDARLGLGYNIDNDGGVVVEDGKAPDTLRAVSRVRFGVDMTGETDSGITFGATIRADNAPGGQGGDVGQFEGSVFVSGSWGTLTLGDTNGADEQWVGDVPGDYSLTGLTEVDETRFISNGGSFDSDSGETFAPDPTARPTIRYDFDIAGFGVSVSSDRDLNAVGVGAGYAAEFAGGSWSVGIGYYKFRAFEEETEAGVAPLDFDLNGNGVIEPGEQILVPVEGVLTTVPEGDQWSFGLKGNYASFAFGATFTTISSDSDSFGTSSADNLLLGASYTFDAFSVGAVYGTVLSGKGDLGLLDGDTAYGVTAQYDLGGGATVNGGIFQSYEVGDLANGLGDNATIADFGIAMEF